MHRPKKRQESQLVHVVTPQIVESIYVSDFFFHSFYRCDKSSHLDGLAVGNLRAVTGLRHHNGHGCRRITAM